MADLTFQSQQAFEGGGSQPSQVGGVASGLGQLANVIAQGPRIAASAQYMAAEAARARAQTSGLTQEQELAQTRAHNTVELGGLLGDPNLLADGAKTARAMAIVASDPNLSQHATGIMGMVIGNAVKNGVMTRQQGDTFMSQQGGGPSYTSTASGQQVAEGAATTRTGMTVQGQKDIANIDVAGRQTIQDTQSVQAVPAGAPAGTSPTTMTRKQANQGGYRIVSDTEAAAQAVPQVTTPPNAPPGTRGTYTPQGTIALHPGDYSPTSTTEYETGAQLVPVVPAGSPPGTPPVMKSRSEIAGGGWTEIAPAQQQAEAGPTSVIGADGRPTLMGTGQATATGAQPVLGGGPGQVQGVAEQGTVWPSSALSGGPPINLTPSTPAPPSPESLPQVIASGGRPQQPPAASPALLPAVTPPGPSPAQRVGAAEKEQAVAARPPLPQRPMDEVASKDLPGQVDAAVTKVYPADPGILGGRQLVWPPEARMQIIQKAQQYYMNNEGLVPAINHAISDLQASGNLPAPGRQGLAVPGKGVVAGAGMVPWNANPQGGPQGPQGGSPTPTTANQGARAVPAGPPQRDRTTGLYWAKGADGRYVQTDPNGNPLGAGGPGPSPAVAATPPAKRAPAATEDEPPPPPPLPNAPPARVNPRTGAVAPAEGGSDLGAELARKFLDWRRRAQNVQPPGY
jgi:hypothetical protein